MRNPIGVRIGGPILWPMPRPTTTPPLHKALLLSLQQEVELIHSKQEI